MVTLTDVVVRDTQSQQSNRELGEALEVGEGAHVQVFRAQFERNREVAVAAFNAGTEVHLNDVIIRDTQSQEISRERGRAIQASDGAVLEVTRGLLERNREIAVAVFDGDTVVSLTDLVIRNTRSQEIDAVFGRAVQARGGADVQVSRALLDRNREIAVAVFDTGTTVNLTDVVVRDTQSQETDQHFGRALQVRDGAQLELTRAVLDQNREVAVAVFDPGTSVHLADLVVEDTRERECADDTCRDRGAGDGIGAYAGGHVDVQRFRIAGSARCGVQLAYGSDADGVRYPVGGTMRLEEGEIASNAVCGANVRTDGFDVGDLQHRVIYRDNPRDIDSSEMVEPESTTSLPPM